MVQDFSARNARRNDLRNNPLHGANKDAEAQRSYKISSSIKNNGLDIMSKSTFHLALVP